MSPLDRSQLADLTWTEAPANGVLVLPLGSTEQHGPHLPLGTDTRVAVELARRLVEAMGDCVLAPALPYGSSGEHAGFAGTLSIGQQALETLVVELVRSADDFAATLVVSGHGGNAVPLRRAVRALSAEGRRLAVWQPAAEVMAPVLEAHGRTVDAHAGAVETSIMLSLDPDLVRPLPGGFRPEERPLPQLMATLVRQGVRAVSPAGVLGDPRHASASLGAALLDALALDLIGFARRQREDWGV